MVVVNRVERHVLLASSLFERSYKFLVTDADGAWGDVTVEAADEETARLRARKWLCFEVYPRGSLGAEYALTLCAPSC